MWRAIAVVSLLFSVVAAAPVAAQSGSPAWAYDAQKIGAMFAMGDHVGVIEAVDRFYRTYPRDAITWQIELFRAESHLARGESESALASLRRVLPTIERMDNVSAGRFAFVYFNIGSLETREKRWTQAIEAIEQGLRLNPHSVMHQVVLGQLFISAGDRVRGVRHFREVLSGLAPSAEARAVIGIKLERLGEGPAPPAPDLSGTLVYPGAHLRLLAMGPADPRISLPDLCLFVQSKWSIGCEVVTPLVVAEDAVAAYDRRQWNGDRVLDRLRRWRQPDGPDERRFGRPNPLEFRNLTVAVVTADIFGEKTDHVYSLQRPGDGLGVVSTHRFVAKVDDAYEPQVVMMRRVGIQLLSTVGSLLGLGRATRPECPTAYPNEFVEFLLKGSRLCQSEVEARDALLTRAGGVPRPVTAEQAQEMARVYRTYRFE